MDEDGERVFCVEAFDDATVSVEVTALCSLAQWDELSGRIRELIVRMQADMAGGCPSANPLNGHGGEQRQGLSA